MAIVLEKSAVTAQHINPLNRVATSASVLNNGHVVSLGSYDSDDNTWTATAPTTGNFNNLWMVFDSDAVAITDSQGNSYKGLTQDPRNFTIPANKEFGCYKPQIEDIIKISTDGITGTANDYAVAANGAFTLAYAAAAIDGLSYEVIDSSARFNLAFVGTGTTYAPNPYTTAIELRCVAN